jgi:hypothetical protein
VEKLIEIYRRRLEEYEMCNVRAVECDLKAWRHSTNQRCCPIKRALPLFVIFLFPCPFLWSKWRYIQINRCFRTYARHFSISLNHLDISVTYFTPLIRLWELHRITGYIFWWLTTIFPLFVVIWDTAMKYFTLILLQTFAS